MNIGSKDTIVALSSGALPSGIAVVRVSGPQARFAVETICGSVPRSRRAGYLAMTAADGGRIDSGIVLFFPGPASFTGEDLAEMQIHGGKAVVAALLDRLTGLPGVRFAEAGEFTRRAFLNGKMDLLEAEAFADLVSAETEAERRLAILNSEGVQSGLYAGWRRRLIEARAMIEAELDFADESDVPGSVSDSIWRDMAVLCEDIRSHIEGYRKAEMIRDGFDVVILGAPNAGKSSLLNALARRDAAIVSDEPGTTRDLVELVLDLGGVKVRITDTAGIREDPGSVESIGIERALARAARSDLILLLVDASTGREVPVPAGAASVLRIGAKADLLGKLDTAEGKRFDFLLSSRTGEGIDELTESIGARAKAAAGTSGEIIPSRMRHVALLREALDILQETVASSEGLELRAEGLRLAGDRLGRISGTVDVEDLLDVIFSQFCIGK